MRQRTPLDALCNAHHLRELQALIEIEKEPWARKMRRLVRQACHATHLARDGDKALKPGLIALIERCYDAVLAEGFGIIRTLISTARKQGWDLLQALIGDPETLIAELRLA